MSDEGQEIGIHDIALGASVPQPEGTQAQALHASATAPEGPQTPLTSPEAADAAPEQPQTQPQTPSSEFMPAQGRPLHAAAGLAESGLNLTEFTAKKDTQFAEFLTEQRAAATQPEAVAAPQESKLMVSQAMAEAAAATAAAKEASPEYRTAVASAVAGLKGPEASQPAQPRIDTQPASQPVPAKAPGIMDRIRAFFGGKKPERASA